MGSQNVCVLGGGRMGGEKNEIGEIGRRGLMGGCCGCVLLVGIKKKIGNEKDCVFWGEMNSKVVSMAGFVVLSFFSFFCKEKKKEREAKKNKK